jgi:Excalibur calcium-binding domain
MMPTNPGYQGPTPVQTTQMMELPLQPPAEEPAGKRRRWLRWAVPILAFLLGIGVGGASNETDVTTTPQYQSLRAELASAQDEAGELSDEVVAAQEQVQQAAAAQAQIEQQTAEISERATALDQREQELAARESALRAGEQSASSSGRTSAGPGSSSSSSSSSSGSVPSGVGSSVVVEREPQVSTSVSYGNCSEARDAGAAPVRVGDPGYGRHLDRDGDGVGCE